MSARNKLLLPFVLLLALVLATMHFVLFDVLKGRLIADALRSERQTLDMIALAVTPNLLDGDLITIDTILAQAQAERPWWRSLLLRGADGMPLSVSAAAPAVEGATLLSTPLHDGQRPLGTLAIRSDLAAPLGDSLDILLKLEILVVGLIVLGAALVVRLQEVWLLAPLAELAAAARALSAGDEDIILPQAGGEVGEVVAAFADMMTAAAARESALRHSENRLAAIIDNSGEAVITLDGTGHIVSCNRAAEIIFGFRQDDVAGLDLPFLVPHHSCRPTEPEGCEAVGRRVDGSEVALWLILTRVILDDGCLFVATISDITARKQAENELRESEGRFRDLAGSASDWFWETDQEYRLTFVSERIGAVLGVKPSALLGFSYLDLGLADAEPGLVQAHAADLAACRPFRDVVFSVGPRGAKDGHFIRISGLPMFDGKGRFQGYRGVGADITREVHAEGQARQARQQLAGAIESINDAIAIYDPQDRLVLCNSEYARVFATTGEEIAPGMTFAEVTDQIVAAHLFDVEPDALKRWHDDRLARHRAATGEPNLARLRDGRWILSRDYRTSDGGAVAVRTDITLLKQREEALDALQRRYQLILDAAGDGIIGLDSQGRIGFANRAAADLLGAGPANLTGQDYHALVDPASASDSDNAVRRAYTQGMAEKVDDALFRHADGRAVQVEYLVAPILEQNTVGGAVVVFRDVSLRRLYERTVADQQQILERQVIERTAALATSRQRLKSITDNLFEGVLVVDHDGMISFANGSARRLLQRPDMVGRPLDDVMRLRQKRHDQTFAEACWPRVMASGQSWQQDDAVFVTAEGRTLSVAFACSPLVEQAACAGAIVSFRDIGQLKTAQQEALQASRLASVGQLAAGIAHEINTPIQYVGDNLRFIRDAVHDMEGVLASARALAQCCPVAIGQDFETAYDRADIDYLAQELPAAIGQSLDGVAQVARIVLSMKEFSHPGSTSKGMTDINRALDSTITVSRNTWKQVAVVETDFADDLPLVPCHAGEINQVFLNLIVNAAHAIEASGKPLPGRIAIQTRRDGRYVRIAVRDNGTGIAAGIKDKIFDPFFTTKAVGKGTGQGLAICLDVVTIKHAGRLDVLSEEGEGATFVVALPIDGAAEAGGS